MRTQLLLILIITTLALSACGKKGPVRPVTKSAVEQPAAPLDEQTEQSN